MKTTERITLGIAVVLLAGTTLSSAETNRPATVLRWGESENLYRWDRYPYEIKTAYPYWNQLPTLDEFPKLLEFSELRSSDRSILVSQLQTLSRCNFVDFQKQDYGNAYTKWRAWWTYYGSQMSERLKKEGRPYPDSWKTLTPPPGVQCPTYPLALPSSWSFQLSFISGDYGGMVKEEISMSVSPTTATLKRRYQRKTNAPWESEEWKGLTVEESQAFLASLIYAIDNPWVFIDDKLAVEQNSHGFGHIKGRPEEWSNYYPSVSWTGILDSEGRVLINDDVWSWHTTNFEKHKVTSLDFPIGVVFRVFRDQFPDPAWNKQRSCWKPN